MSLQDYQFLGKLGAGSFGVVHKARDRKTNNIVVLKVVDISKMNAKLRKNAMEEGKILQQMNSPYIVKHFNTFIVKSSLHIVMEYCPKGDLAAFLKAQMGKSLKEDRIWKFSIQMMAGLRDLHLKKILHRDMKALNVFLDADHNVRIGDLGVAKAMKTDFAYTIVGTPYYLSPQMCEQKPYNEKTDIWAMGCIIYELCTGKHPFQANNQAALALKIVMGKYSPIPSTYSSDLSWIVQSCLSLDYKRRPSAAYLLAMPKVAEIARKLNIPLTAQEKKLEAVNILPVAPPSVKKQQSKKSQTESEKQNSNNKPAQKKQKSIEKVVQTPSKNNVKPIQEPSKQAVIKVPQQQQQQSKSRQKDAKVKVLQARKTKDQFFDRMKVQNQNKRLSAARQVQLKEKQKVVNISKQELPPKPIQKQPIQRRGYESQKPKTTTKTAQINLLFGAKDSSSSNQQKMNITMNRFMPQNVKKKNLIDLEDESRFQKQLIPDSDDSSEEREKNQKKQEKINNKSGGMKKIVQMAQQQVDDDFLQEFGIPSNNKKDDKKNQQSSPEMMQFKLQNKTKTINWDLQMDEEHTSTMNDIKSQLQVTPDSDEQGQQAISPLSTTKTKNNSNTKVNSDKKGLMKQIPTIKTNAPSDLGQVKIQECCEDETEDFSKEGNGQIMEEIDENRPYISEQEQEEDNDKNIDSEQQQLLIEDFDQKEQDLNKKQSENEKRKTELDKMKNHYQSQILKLLPKKQYERLKIKLIECGQDEVQQFVASWKNNLKAINLFYRIIHFDMEIKRCQANIEAIKEKIVDIKKFKQ